MTTAAKSFDVAILREDFPILHQSVHGHPLVYLDNAASAQKPRAVIDAISQFYSSDYSNIHRGVHSLSERSTKLYEDGRIKTQRLINARHSKEIIFTRGTTEGINLVAQSYGRKHVGAGRRNPDHGSGTSFEHRAVADAVRGKRREAAHRSGR